MRSVPYAALVVAMLVLCLSVALATTQHDERRRTVERQLTEQADEHARDLENYFARARSVVLLTANAPAFRRAIEAPPSRPNARRRAVRDATTALGYLERLYPASIGEACFIDGTGTELARVVRGEVAAPDDLSTKEEDAPFFTPTMSLPVGKVHHALPYRSPDTGEWVIANATRVPGRRAAMVHFEVTVESFRRELAGSSTVNRALIVDARTGRVIADSRRPQRNHAPLGDPDDRRYRPLAHSGLSRGLMERDGHLTAYRRVPVGRGNANAWLIAVSSEEATGGMLGSVGVLPIVLFALGLALLGFACFALIVGDGAIRRAADTDALTGLGNRRRLVADLERAVARGGSDPAFLALLDLNGFKQYNDTFGHLAGDALLTRMGAVLGREARALGCTAYRLGGDEFCVLGPGAHRTEAELAAGLALTEQGEGFSITASAGCVLIPDEADTPEAALRRADQLMYAAKNLSRPRVGDQTRDVLVRALAERHPCLATHGDSVAETALAVAHELGFPDERLDTLRHAAALHDIGKVAIPGSIVTKPGPLNEEEWAFIRQHTIIGERILSAAPALVPAAAVVRATHEQWDGGGYPDGLAAEAIPFEARIIAVCDAFEAMTEGRAYAPAISREAAFAELERCAAGQFDPDVVRAFLAVARTGAVAR